MTRLKLIKKITSDWFDSHAFVNEVYWGDFIRWYAEKQLKHSSVIITPVRVTEVTRSKRSIQLQITYADRVYADFRNLDEVHSDADRVLADFILSASNDKEVRKYLTGLTSGSIEYFTNRTGDLIAGATMSVSLNVFSDANSCEIPVDFKPQPTPFECEDVVIVVNSTTLGTVASGDTLDVEVTDFEGNPQDVDASLTGADLAIQTKWWTRPSGWLPMPEITASDNKFAGLYAVFEDGFNAVAILLSQGNHSINWGDGSTDSGSGTNQTYNHVYDYATISGAVLVSDDGRNYKQVMVEVDFDSDTNVLRVNETTTPSTGTNLRSQNWLEFIGSSTNASFVLLDFGIISTYKCAYLQKINWIGSITSLIANRTPALKVLGIDYSQTLTQIQFSESGDFRADDNGGLVNLNTDVNFAIGSFADSNIKKLGNINSALSTSHNNIFRFCQNLKSVGSINAINTTSLLDAFRDNIRLKSIGTISVTTSLTQMTRAFRFCRFLSEIVFSGDMSGVNSISDCFTQNLSLRRLILPNITIGFDIRDSQITGDNLQDLGASLGDYNGVGLQTITLPAFTIGEPTTVFTDKGYIVAYA